MHISHSCDPNCEMVVESILNKDKEGDGRWEMGHMSMNISKRKLRAIKNIAVGSGSKNNKGLRHEL